MLGYRTKPTGKLPGTKQSSYLHGMGTGWKLTGRRLVNSEVGWKLAGWWLAKSGAGRLVVTS